MKTQLVLVPEGWLCSLGECRPGFFVYKGNLCLQTEYAGCVYCGSGEVFWGDTGTKEIRQALQVQPVKAKWEEVE